MNCVVVCTAGALWLSAVVLLGGCASGNKLAATANPTVTPYTGPPVVLRRAAGSFDGNALSGESTARNADNAQRQGSLGKFSDGDQRDALTYFNARRIALGLPPIVVDTAITEAAAAHAHYLIGHGEAGHTEQRGNADFTGTDVANRLSFRLPVTGASEVLTRYGGSFSDGEAIRELFASPYHRGVILFDWQLGGAALQRADASVLVVDFANIRPTLAPNELVAYPYDGQRGVPNAWTDNEVPDPLGDDPRYRGRRVGFPVTLSGGPNAHIAWRRATLTDASGQAADCKIAPVRPADNARNTAICTPLEPLKTNTRYRMEAVGSLTQLSRFTTIAPFSLRWTFTTE